MFQIRNGKFADAVVPVGMSRPFHIKRLGQIEGQLDAFALELIYDATIIDTVDGNFTASLLVEEALAALLQLKNIHHRNAQLLLSDSKIAERLLLFRVDLQQDHIFGV